MEFSWSYSDTMHRMLVNNGFRRVSGGCTYAFAPTTLTFDIDPNSTMEIPTFCANAVERGVLRNATQPLKIVIPLAVDNYVRTVSGAETMLKHFSRNPSYNARVNKVTTPKGEVYYGNSGIVLDKEFQPLMLVTVEMSRNDAGYFRGKTKVYLSPKVFTDDQSMLNKHLAKKGIAYILTHPIITFPEEQLNTIPEVVIDDMSQFFKKSVKPDVNASSEEEFNKVLKDNIDEVLGQFQDDLSKTF